MADFNMVPEDDDDVELLTLKEEALETTVLDSLKNELKRVVKNDPLTLAVPSRPGMSIVFDTNVEATQLQHWRKASSDKSMPDKFDGLKFSAIIIANQALQVLYKNEIAVDTDGNDLNFRNPNFTAMLGNDRASVAVRKLYGVDGHIFIVANQILSAAGYDDGEQGATGTDPTLVS